MHILEIHCAITLLSKMNLSAQAVYTHGYQNTNIQSYTKAVKKGSKPEEKQSIPST